MSLQDQVWKTVLKIASTLDESDIAYSVVGTAAVVIQGVRATSSIDSLDFDVQWDRFLAAHEALALYGPSEIEKLKGEDRFHFTLDVFQVNVVCHYNTVVATDPYRVSVQRDSIEIWAKSMDDYLRRLPPTDPIVQAIQEYYRELQQATAHHNQHAWGQEVYDAWIRRFGQPLEVAERIMRDPAARLSPLHRYIGADLRGQKVINLLGSHGAKAIAMALLGADATVVDMSAENQRYALEVAKAAKVKLRYIVSDVLSLPESELTADYDLVLMELGILHYFVDLTPLLSIVANLLCAGGRLILHDFHPVSTKLITSTGKKHKVTGNYFDRSIHTTDVAYSKHLESVHNPISKVYLRKWTLGEIVTGIANAGMLIRVLEEEPNTKLHDIGIPKTFTVVAQRL